MKKFLALMMTLAMMCGMLVSCDDAYSLLEKATAAMNKEPYSMTMKMNYECDNEELNEMFSLMNMEIPATVDGENVAIGLSMDLMGYTIGIDVMVVDKVMYYNMDLMGEIIKVKATLNEEQYQEFLAENNTEMAVKPTDFGKLTVENKDGKQYISCEEISEEGLKALNDIMANALADVDGEAALNDVSYCVILNGGKYESMVMTCTYSITVADETFNVTFDMSSEFSYDNVAEITAPADADEYEEASYEDLMG